MQAARTSRAQRAQQVTKRQPGVHDVLDEKHVLIFDAVVEVLQNAHDAWIGARLGVRYERSDGEKIQACGNRQSPSQIGEEEHRSFEYAYKNGIATGVVAGNFRRDRG